MQSDAGRQKGQVLKQVSDNPSIIVVHAQVIVPVSAGFQVRVIVHQLLLF